MPFFIETNHRLKLQQFFPQYETYWAQAIPLCQQELNNYFHQNETIQCPHPCACAADCLLQNVTGTMQSNFASAQVLLGILPTIMVAFGPAITETAALSTYTPLLAVLLALGSPAVNVSRLFHHENVIEPFVRPESKTSSLWAAWLIRQNVVVRILIRVLGYLCTLLAIVNNAHNSLYVDLRTASGWRCSLLLMPLAWSFLPTVIHVAGMVAIRLRKQLYSQYKITVAFKSVLKSTTYKNVCNSTDDVLSEALFWSASVGVVVHMVFGILVLSSLMFISTREAFGTFVRYAASSFVCQVVLQIELANMR